MKRLKNIGSKNKEQLKAIEVQGNKQLSAIKNINAGSKLLKAFDFFSGLSPEAKKLLDELKKEKNTIDPEKLVCVKTDETIFNFNTFKNSLDFASNIYHKGKSSLKDAKDSQYKMFGLLNHLKKYEPKNLKKTKSKEEALTNAEKLYNNRDNFIKSFENKVFLFSDGFKEEESGMSDKSLPNWVKIGKKRFDRIKNQIQKAKDKNLDQSMVVLFI